MAMQVDSNAADDDGERVQQDAAPEAGVGAAVGEGERVQQDVPLETDVAAVGPIRGTGQQPIRQTLPEPPHGKRARAAAASDEDDRDDDDDDVRQGDSADDAGMQTKGTKRSKSGRPAKAPRSAPAAPTHTPRTSGRVRFSSCTLKYLQVCCIVTKAESIQTFWHCIYLHAL